MNYQSSNVVCVYIYTLYLHFIFIVKKYIQYDCLFIIIILLSFK